MVLFVEAILTACLGIVTLNFLDLAKLIDYPTIQIHSDLGLQ